MSVSVQKLQREALQMPGLGDSESSDLTQHRALVKRFAESCQEAVQASSNVLLAAQAYSLY